MIPRYQTLLSHHPMKQATSVTKASYDRAAESYSKTEPDSVATSDGEKSALPWPTFIQMVSPDILLAEAHLIEIERKKVLKERPIPSSSDSNGY